MPEITHQRAGPTKAPPGRDGAKLVMCAITKGLPISSERQQAHHSNAALQGWFHRGRAGLYGGGRVGLPSRLGHAGAGAHSATGDQQARPFNGGAGRLVSQRADHRKSPARARRGEVTRCIVGGLYGVQFDGRLTLNICCAAAGQAQVHHSARLPQRVSMLLHPFATHLRA